jgi:hypothetical protein
LCDGAYDLDVSARDKAWCGSGGVIGSEEDNLGGAINKMRERTNLPEIHPAELLALSELNLQGRNINLILITNLVPKYNMLL